MSPGELVTPTLRLVRLLGSGGMGSVWIADNLALHVRVAVKFMSRELSRSEEARARFAREAAAASQVKSAHVVQTFDHGLTKEGVPFIAMELLEGEDLASRQRRVGALSPRDLATVVSQTARALSKAHERGIVHRDIKPENIFLCDNDDDEIFVKILDFGIAKVIDPVHGTTRTGALMGTAYYMSPEQIVGSKQVDHRTDIWALGVVAYEMLTDRYPFDGETIGAIALAMHASNPIPPTTHRPELPREIDAWFAKACATDPLARFQSVKELSRSLSTILTPPLARAGVAESIDVVSAPPPPPRPPVPTTTGGQVAVSDPVAPRATSSARLPALSFALLGAFALVIVTVVAVPFVRRSTLGGSPVPSNAKERETSARSSVAMHEEQPTPKASSSAEAAAETSSSSLANPSATPKPPPRTKNLVLTPTPRLTDAAASATTQPSPSKVPHDPVLF